MPNISPLWVIAAGPRRANLRARVHGGFTVAIAIRLQRIDGDAQKIHHFRYLLLIVFHRRAICGANVRIVRKEAILVFSGIPFPS